MLSKAHRKVAKAPGALGALDEPVVADEGVEPLIRRLRAPRAISSSTARLSSVSRIGHLLEEAV